MPFYVLPLFLGLIAVDIGFKPQVVDGLFLEFVAAYAPNWISAMVSGSLTAIILSTANTYVLVLAGVVSRNILPLRDNLGFQQLLILVLGIAATMVAFVANDIVSVILGAFFVIIALVPAAVCAVLSLRPNPIFVSAGMLIGGLAAILSYPFIGPQAFLPAIVLSAVITALGSRNLKTRQAG